jgi:AcrR family transcriptional regulator
VRGSIPATVEALIDATISQLELHGTLGVRLEAVAERAGVTLGAIYHHFGDKDGLIDAARLTQFTRHADADTAALRAALSKLTDHEQLMRALPRISAAFQSADRRDLRRRRMENFAATATRPEYAERIAEVQHRVTAELTDLIEDLKARHLIDESADSHALATFIQAYTLGHVVADVDHDPVPVERWNRAILAALTALMPPPTTRPPAPSATPLSTEVTSANSSLGPATIRGQATARAMVDAARLQLETRPDSEFRVDEVLASVGASPSSLYHHFGNREGLLEAAWIDWARQNAETDVTAVAAVFAAATDRDAAFDGVVTVVRAAQAPSRTERRLQRLSMIAAAARRPGLRAEISQIETETNRRYRAILDEAQERGLISPEADLEVIPVFMRAITFGRITNELSSEPVDPAAWDHAMVAVLAQLLGTPR